MTDWKSFLARLCCGVLCVVAVAAFAIPSPVWVEGAEDRRPEFVSFRTTFDWDGASDLRLKIAASAVYRVCVNGSFAGWGPARTVYGFARVDEWPIAARKGRNTLTVDVAGYRFESFQYNGGEPFLLAEIVSNGKCLVGTPFGFEAIVAPRCTRGPKYSRQRGFTAEAYAVDADWLSWMSGGESYRARLPITNAPSPRWQKRTVPCPEYKVNSAFRTTKDACGRNIWCLPSIDSGFIGLEVFCQRPGRIVVEFDEALGTNGVIDISRNGDPLTSWHAMYNRVIWDVKDAGHYVLETIEPYTLKYLNCIVENGESARIRPYVRQCRNPLVSKAVFKSSDEELNALFAAAKESLAQNAVDILTDCPSRERVGWLCDTYFSSEALAWLTGDFSIEQEYLLNFARTDDFGPDVPAGAIPGFMPSRRGSVMPTYMMWYVIQCCAAAERMDQMTRENFVRQVSKRIEGVLNWLGGFEKEGLLENLPGWVFVEWSRANDYVKGVNYPVNMLWAYALNRGGIVMNRPEWCEKARRVRHLVGSRAYDGMFFHDQSVRDEEGKLVRNENAKSEICQYYAYFTELAAPQTYASHWKMLVDDFGPGHRQYPDVDTSEAFIGWLLRLELLARFGEHARLVSDMKAYYGKMASESGTLWEFSDGHDSRCHAVGSYIAVLLVRQLLGVRNVDWATRTLILNKRTATLSDASCSLPVTGGLLSHEKGQWSVPSGWRKMGVD